MYLVIDHDFAFLGKSELLKWPVINIFLKEEWISQYTEIVKPEQLNV